MSERYTIKIQSLNFQNTSFTAITIFSIQFLEVRNYMKSLNFAHGN